VIDNKDENDFDERNSILEKMEDLDKPQIPEAREE